MSIRDLQPASFRGVKFHVVTSATEFGRRKVVHEFPGRDKPFTEDMGKKAERFPVEGYIVGDNHKFTRDLLIAAANKPGAGRLYHPYYGLKTVDCLSLKVTETASAGGMVRVSFEFVESGEALFPMSFVDELLELASKIDQAISQVALRVSELLDVLNGPAYLLDSAANTIGKLADFISSSNGLGAAATAVSDIPASVDRLKRSARELAKAPSLLAERTLDSIELLANGVVDKRVAVESVLAIPTQVKALPKPNPTTRTRRQEARNHKALVELIARQCTLVASRAVMDSVSVGASGLSRTISSKDARELRDSINEAIDEILDQAEDDQAFAVFSDLRAQLTRAIPGGASLPDVRSMDLLLDRPALVVAYDVYGSLERDSDVIERNGVVHPGQITGGRTLEVLSA